MLVLSRKQNESVVIDQEIRVVVLQVSQGSVRLGIEAPGHVPVHRHEVFQRIRDESSRERGTCDP